MEAIILAGGFGTRLQPVVSNVPKSMAVIRDRPFLEYQLDYLIGQGTTKAVLSVGYKHEIIMNHFGSRYKSLEIEYAIENEPMGTGGGIRLSFWKIDGTRALILNGDSMFRFNFREMMDFHLKKRAEVTLALRKLKDTSRYGRVSMGRTGRIKGFSEKEPGQGPGFINGGIYIMEKKTLMEPEFRGKFSIEKDFFGSRYTTLKMYGFEAQGYFLDIGIPDDFKKAQDEFTTFID